MGREYRPNVRESAVISKMDQDKEQARQNALGQLRDVHDELASWVAMRLIEDKLIETTSKKDLEGQISFCIGNFLDAEEFDIQFHVAKVRDLVPRPNMISLYITAFIIENLIDHKCIVEIYGTDEDIYRCVHKEVIRLVGTGL